MRLNKLILLGSVTNCIEHYVVKSQDKILQVSLVKLGKFPRATVTTFFSTGLLKNIKFLI